MHKSNEKEKRKVFSDAYEGTKWIKTGPFKVDPKWTIKERYEALKAHHKAETEFLLEELRNVASEVDERDEEIKFLNERVDELEEDIELTNVY